MKTVKIITLVFICSLLPVQICFASGIPLSWGGEKIVKIADLPNTEYFSIDGKHVNIGIIFKQIEIGWPVINYNKRWCLFSGTTYWEFSKDDLDDIANEIGILLPADMKLPFFDAWGGKLIWLCLFTVGIILIIFNKYRSENIVKCSKCNRIISIKKHLVDNVIKCPHCGDVYANLLYLNIQGDIGGLKIPLVLGKKLYHENIVSGSSNYHTVVGEVIKDDAGENDYRLKNKSGFGWTVIKSDGIQETILPDNSFVIEDKMEIVFKGLTGTINRI